MSVKDFYSVNTLFTEVPVQVGAEVHKLAMQWIDGQIGALPVFSTHEEATAFLLTIENEGTPEVTHFVLEDV